MTTGYRVGFSLLFTADTDATPDEFAEFLDIFYTELLAIEDREADIIDPDLAAHLADFTVDVILVVEADAPLDAQVRGATTLRTALHAIGVGTPGWEAVIASITAPSSADLQDA